MPVPDALPTDPDTRTRLLEAAGEVFAERGFRAATVRDICQHAGANVAAINYHFGDKETLYREVLERTAQETLERYPPDHGLGPDPSAEERLHAFVRSFLLRVLTGDKPAWFMRLLAREMIQPTGALDRLVESVHKPLFLRLRGIVAEIAGAGVDPQTITWSSQAVVAQCLFYRHAQAVIERMGHKVPGTPDEIDRLADQITRFSLAGIRERARGARKETA
jgi:AcrR family transcriptional regulator